MKISILNGGGQTDYMYGLVSGLSQFDNVLIYVLDSSANTSLFSKNRNVKFVDVIKVLPPKSQLLAKAKNILRFYFKQFYHLTFSKRGIAHFQWLDRFYIPDRILLPIWARIMGHKVVLTVHNVNSKKRDNNDTWLNLVTLKGIYLISNKLIVHTSQSKKELLQDFSVKERKISILRHGTNNKVEIKGINAVQARNGLKLSTSDKILLFFGNIDYYKGVDLLLDSISFLPKNLEANIHILIAGNSKSAEYTELIKKKIFNDNLQNKVTTNIHHIPDKDVETYFMAADCIVLPYRNIYQSGVIFMAYTFGLPVIVPNIGNFQNDIVNGKTGLLACSNEPKDLAIAITTFFESSIYKNLKNTRDYIKEWASREYSWENIGKETKNLYESLS